MDVEAPLGDVPAHVVQAVAVRGEASNGREVLETIVAPSEGTSELIEEALILRDGGERVILDVLLSDAVYKGYSLVPSDVFPIVVPGPGRVLPLSLRGKTVDHSLQFGELLTERHRIMLRHANDWVGSAAVARRIAAHHFFVVGLPDLEDRHAENRERHIVDGAFVGLTRDRV